VRRPEARHKTEPVTAKHSAAHLTTQSRQKLKNFLATKNCRFRLQFREKYQIKSGGKKTELKIYKAGNRKIRAIENPLTVVQKRMHTRTLSLSLARAHRSYPDSLSLKKRNRRHLGVLEKKGRGKKKQREREDEAAAHRRWF